MGRKVTIYMIDGIAVGPRTVEIGNWTGKAIYSSRSSIKGILKRSEFDNPAVYILQSQSDTGDYQDKVYIGETENLRKRMEKHLSERDFTDFVAFVSKDENLTKAHIKYLESRLIEFSEKAKSSQVENINSSNQARLPEADVSDMEYFLEQIRLVLPLMGFRCLVPSVVDSSVENISSQSGRVEKVTYFIERKGFSATMVESDQGYIVKKGSQCSKSTARSMAQGWLKIRENLINKEILETKGSYLEFKEDAIFNSSSAAASVVLGKQSAGPVSWRDKTGKTLKDNQS